MIKGSGAALTCGEIIADASDQFTYLINASKQVKQLGVPITRRGYSASNWYGCKVPS